ncbi:MAG: GNAT family N-acetyltransferase [Mycoplasmataceae bacterium]|jgi:predicted GNAT family acetyltransferase|nr:GNAT family N-acetyltransferase [Mycoplasmataceae bacterium]
MSSYTISKRNSGVIELSITTQSNAYIRLQDMGDNIYCAITTFVDPSLRGKGIGRKLYKALIEFVRDTKVKFSATCPFIVKLAESDKTITDIYLKSN